MLWLPINIAHADVDSLIQAINTEIINPAISVLFVLAFLFFFWGLFEFLWGRDNTEARKKGQQHMIWGVIGIFIMVAVFGIINLIMATLGVN